MGGSAAGPAPGGGKVVYGGGVVIGAGNGTDGKICAPCGVCCDGDGDGA